MSDENTKVMSADDFAVYTAKVNEWVDTVTPLIKGIETKKARNFAEFDLAQIQRLLMEMDDSPTLELKQRIHLAGKMFPVGIWPFVRGRGSTLDPQTQLVVDTHVGVAEAVYTAFWEIRNNIPGAENLSIFRLSGRADENPYGQIESGEEFIKAKVNAEKQGLMSKHRNKVWDGNAEMVWTTEADNSGNKESDE